jgi:DNA transposition AAA+ family ATPase
MLPKNHQFIYETLLDRLLTLAKAIEETDTLARTQVLGEIQTLMREQVLSLSDDNLAIEVAAQWRRVQTELIRSWRLLETDWLFLASSGKSSDRRLETIRQRLTTLMQYCHLLLA